MKILKYKIKDLTVEHGVDLPSGFMPLHLAAQRQAIMLWARVDSKPTSLTRRYFRIAGTGHEIADDAKYIGTWQSGPSVWHLVELNK